MTKPALTPLQLWTICYKLDQAFYHNTESCILNNGWSSNFFKLEKGVRQGCPLSPYLFILGAEILAETIRINKNIKGITINEQEVKISQYANKLCSNLSYHREDYSDQHFSYQNQPQG